MAARKLSTSQKPESDEPLYRMDSVPPADGESVYDKETAVGDWSLALAEMRRADSASQATSKLAAFDLARALAATRERELERERDAALHAPASGTRRREPSRTDDDAAEDALAGGFDVVGEVTIDVADAAPRAPEPEPPPPRPSVELRSCGVRSRPPAAAANAAPPEASRRGRTSRVVLVVLIVFVVALAAFAIGVIGAAAYVAMHGCLRIGACG